MTITDMNSFQQKAEFLNKNSSQSRFCFKMN